MNYITKLWDLITENGIDEEKLGMSAVKFRLANQLIFLSLLTSVFALLSYIITNEDIKFVWTTIGNISLEIAIIILLRYRKYDAAMFLSSWVFASLVAFNVILLGGNFGEVNIFTALSLVSFIFYNENKIKQFSVVFYICLLFVGSKLYVIRHFIEPIGKESPYDEIITFPMIVIILGLIILLYQKELKKHEQRQMALIKDLEQKNKTLLSIHKELEEFTYIASHDLKTPLRTISSHLDLLKRHLDRNEMEAVMQDLQYAKTGTKQMYALVNDILEYKESNNRKESEAILDLNELVAEVMEHLEENLKDNTVLVYNEGLPTIKGYKNELLVVFKNIIENGLKYNYALNPTINIFYEIINENIVIHFKDNGIGIEPEYHEKVFQFFKRLHRNEEFEGTGIGLGLCQKIIRNYNGLISLNSAKNKGSEFIVHLPLEILIL